MDTLGLDLGTNSIGWSKRNSDLGMNIAEQLECFGVMRFEQGVGKDQGKEFSYAVKRTQFRSTRRLYQARKYRIWETLSVLIKYNLSPLSIEDLNKWKIYNKEKGLKREYPINAKEFEKWVRLDFDNDGKPEYISPYQLRAEIATKKLNLSNQIDRYKIGRALYHIAQRRGFKSSKGDTNKLQELKNDEELDEQTLKRSEEKASKGLNDYIQKKKQAGVELKTVGCAFYELEKEGFRIRDNYQAVRSQYEEEIKYIFNFQQDLVANKDLYTDIHKAIFFKRPLRSQKGLVGKCTLEPTKPRCPISHPEFEAFRAWSFINNIKYRQNNDDEWQTLDLELKHELYKEKFTNSVSKKRFQFIEIREWIEKTKCLSLSYSDKTINYKDNTNVDACPITARIKGILGDDWRTVELCSSKERYNKKRDETHKITYNWQDIWHICFSFDDEEHISEFAKTDLQFDDKKTKKLINLWATCQRGYSMLSLKAIQNTNVFLDKGLIYTNAVLLAKLPEILGKELWEKEEQSLTTKLVALQGDVRKRKQLYGIVNELIAEYKSKEINNQFANKNCEYKLCDEDKKDIEVSCINTFGEKTWKEKKTEEEKNTIRKEVARLYQEFFATSKRDYYSLPEIGKELQNYLQKTFTDIDTKTIQKLYHPSQIDFYQPSKNEIVDFDGTNRTVKLLHDPKIGAFKNPMAMRMLYMLRRLLNYLLKKGVINENTRIVVETARDLNDANMRKAIKTYQERQEKENKEIQKILEELKLDSDNSSNQDKIKILADQYEVTENGSEYIPIDKDVQKKNNKQITEKERRFPTDIDKEKYKLLREQGFRCMYTGKMISLSDIFCDTPKFDIEHTLPQSKTLDNSLANKTISDSYYNRNIKKDSLPTSMPNYYKDVTIGEDIYTAILPRLTPWFETIERLESNVLYWKNASKYATTKDRKDYTIVQRHLWQMELDYWKDKVSRFTMEEIPKGFTHRQLVDTRLISKYATLYLKSVFKNVDVQKGTVTAAFRKIIGLQNSQEKKNRSKHSHHAIDATMLTLIPMAAKRDRILSLFYEREEKKLLRKTYKDIEDKLKNEISSLHIGNANEIISKIEGNILVNNEANDTELKHAKRKARRRGQIVYLDKEKKHPKLLQGDCIRGELHAQSFYGAITQAQKDEKGNILRDDNGNMIIDSTKRYYAIRQLLKCKANNQDTGFEDWEDLEKRAVDKATIQKLKDNYKGKTLKDACAEGQLFYWNNKKEKQFVRHIRCYARITNPIKVKKQTYKSEKEYKKYYYADGGDLYAMCKYENQNQKKYIVYSLFDIAQNRKYGIEDIPNSILIRPKKGNVNLQLADKSEENYYYEDGNKLYAMYECVNQDNNDFVYIISSIAHDIKDENILNKNRVKSKQGDIKLQLACKLVKGMKVLLLDKGETIANIKKISMDNLSKRLYVFTRPERDNRVNLINHLFVDDKSKGISVNNFSKLPTKIRQHIKGLNLLVEGKDFTIIPDGQIKFIDNK